jgi:enoyl-CoA hydratase
LRKTYSVSGLGSPFKCSPYRVPLGFSPVTVTIERNPPVLVVTIERPGVRNAVDRPTAEKLSEAFRSFSTDDECLVAVLTGSGETFCAGFDLKALATADRDGTVRIEADGDGPMGPTRLMVDKPTIAAIEGYAVAGGLELALWCDLRIAAEDAVLGVFNRRFGVPLIDGGTIRLARTVGQARALDLILTGRAVGAPEALSMGLVNRVVPPDGALDAAVELAHEIASFPQASLRADRRSAVQQWSLDERAALQLEFANGIDAVASGEAVAGARRFDSGEGRHGS